MNRFDRRFLFASRGFTLLELLAVMAIVAILAGLAVPGMRGMISSGKVVSERDTLADAVRLARSEAILRERFVQLCASEDGLECGGDFADGWIVVERPSNEIIEMQLRTMEGIRYLGDFAGVAFDASGVANTGGGSDLTICANSGSAKGRGFSLAASGAITLANNIEC